MTTETIFTSEVPDSSSNDGNSPRVLGVDFSTAVAGTVASMRYYVTGPVRPTDVTLALYDPSVSTVTPMSTGTASPSGNGWLTISLAATQTLVAGHTYTAAAFITLGAGATNPDYGFTAAVFGSDFVHLTLTAKAGTGRFLNNQGALAYPTGTSDYNFFVDVDFVPVLLETFTDTFATKDTGAWTWDGTSGVSGGQLNLTPTAGYDDEISSIKSYSLVDSYAFIKMVTAPLGTGTIGTFFALYTDTDFVRFVREGSDLTMRETTAGGTSATSVTYDATAHLWLRIRQASGTLYWETSADGSSWTTRRSKSPDRVWDQVQVRVWTGFYGTEPTPGTAVFDNFNVAGTAYTKSLAGTCTSTGGLAKAASKSLAGTGASSGALAKVASKALAGAMASTGALARQCQKALSGSVATAGGLGKAAAKAVAGALSSLGALSFPGSTRNATSTATVAARRTSVPTVGGTVISESTVSDG